MANLHISYTLEASQLPRACIQDCSAIGDVSNAVSFWCRRLGFSVDRERALRYLHGFGAWTAQDLAAADERTLAERVLWIACSDFAEWSKKPDRAGSDIIVLE